MCAMTSRIGIHYNKYVYNYILFYSSQLLYLKLFSLHLILKLFIYALHQWEIGTYYYIYLILG